jgi:hypothetical protein
LIAKKRSPKVQRSTYSTQTKLKIVFENNSKIMNQPINEDLIRSNLRETLALTKDRKFYVNEVEVLASSVDILLNMSWNGETEALVNVSLPVAKSLAKNILNAIVSLEQKLGQKIYDLEELEGEILSNSLES